MTRSSYCFPRDRHVVLDENGIQWNRLDDYYYWLQVTESYFMRAGTFWMMRDRPEDFLNSSTNRILTPNDDDDNNIWTWTSLWWHKTAGNHNHDSRPSGRREHHHNHSHWWHSSWLIIFSTAEWIISYEEQLERSFWTRRAVGFKGLSCRLLLSLLVTISWQLTQVVTFWYIRTF